MAGSFVISLDFELHWGVRDKLTADQYRANLLGARKVIPLLLDLFARYEIAATWATVGILFTEGKESLLACAPECRPQYRDPLLSAYSEFEHLGDGEESDPYHFAPSIIRMLKNAPRQEIGSHTFSHYYTLEPGQTAESFRADLIAAKTVASKFGVQLRSLVFPRNQVNPAYLPICSDLGFVAYRGTELDPLNGMGSSAKARLLRLADAYVNVTKRFPAGGPAEVPSPVSVPQNAFLRPFHPRLRALDGLRIRRICNAMTEAAIEGGSYHLWWHPHNFGDYPTENLAVLSKIIDHYLVLRDRYGFASETMLMCAERKMSAKGAGA